jgi:PAS domain S-box-containing protein
MGSEAGQRADRLEALSGDVRDALLEVALPMYVLDRRGRIAWLNRAASTVAPDAIGQKFTEYLPPDQLHHGRRRFASRILGQATLDDHATAIVLPDGQRHEVEISSVPLRRRQQIVGVFGVIHPPRSHQQAQAQPAEQPPTLTPREHEVLRLLGAGLTTEQMAEQLGLSPDTIRNHIKGLLAGLNARTRLDAVLTAYRLGLLQPPTPTG